MPGSYENIVNYTPPLERADDFEPFWAAGLRELAAADISWQETDYAYPLPQVRVRRVVLAAVDGAPLHGLYLCPAGAGVDQPVPGLIRWHGYSSNCGQIGELLPWALMGFAVLALDVRGQTGASPDPRRYKTGSFSGWMTRGLDAPENYYYYRVYTDAVQAALALALRPEVAPWMAFFGNSQGAGISVAAAALLSRFGGEFADWPTPAALGLGTPFLTHFSLALSEQRGGPLDEFGQYFRMSDPLHRTENHILRVLSYFDIMNFAPWVECPALIAVALRDTVCPPPAVFALVNHLRGKREVCVYPDYEHERIDPHLDRLILFLAGQAPLNRQSP
ncbi:MAG: acetylxylan esterase [Gracilibacteraceae bacterium]|jgi:cephalosporin-C deacetylase|nr:acetylxylan esterase [Gracilibacteraceae bacterium]